MTDKKLLEFAAKAAGYELIEMSDKSLTHINTGGHDKSNWNPLNDDGDALRLAVKLRLSIESDAHIEIGFDPGMGGEYEEGIDVWLVHKDGSMTKAQEVYGADPGAATRRAIIRAAAEIGKAMTSAA